MARFSDNPFSSNFAPRPRSVHRDGDSVQENQMYGETTPFENYDQFKFLYSIYNTPSDEPVTLEELEEELSSQNMLFNYAQCLQRAEVKQKENFIKATHAFALLQYTLECPLYSEVNCSLRAPQQIDSDGNGPDYLQYVRTLNEAIRGWEPDVHKQLYRGVADKTPEDLGMSEGQMWPSLGFFSTSRRKGEAKHFANLHSISKDPSTLITITKHHSGRFIGWCSFTPREEEVLFPSFCIFKVTRKPVKEDRNWWSVEMEEVDIPLNSRVLMIVDDFLCSADCRSLISAAERNQVQVIPMSSTKDAIRFLKNDSYKFLLQKPTRSDDEKDPSAFRILTDMKRGDSNDEGARFISKLRIELKYDKRVIVYTRKVAQSRKHVKEWDCEKNTRVTGNDDFVMNYCCFSDDGDRSKHEYKYYEVTPIKVDKKNDGCRLM